MKSTNTDDVAGPVLQVIGGGLLALASLALPWVTYSIGTSTAVSSYGRSPVTAALAFCGLAVVALGLLRFRVQSSWHAWIGVVLGI
jgi:hypothetical protein